MFLPDLINDCLMSSDGSFHEVMGKIHYITVGDDPDKVVFFIYDGERPEIINFAMPL